MTQGANILTENELTQARSYARGWNAALEAAIRIADGYHCGCCGMDGKAATEIRGLLKSSIPID
jgi:hypothetical protein